MNKAQLALIKKEIQVDNPTDYPADYADLDNYYVAASFLNDTLDQTIQKRVLKSDIVRYISSNDLLTAILDKRNDVTPDKAKPARTIIWLLENSLEDTIDVNDTAFQSGLESLVADTVINQMQSDAITAMGNISISRTKKLGLPKVRAGHIQEALK